jgi:hypothetical protein
MKAAELRGELQRRGLSTEGLKADLEKRLAAALVTHDDEAPLSTTASRPSVSGSARTTAASPDAAKPTKSSTWSTFAAAAAAVGVAAVLISAVGHGPSSRWHSMHNSAALPTSVGDASDADSDVRALESWLLSQGAVIRGVTARAAVDSGGGRGLYTTGALRVERDEIQPVCSVRDQCCDLSSIARKHTSC